MDGCIDWLKGRAKAGIAARKKGSPRAPAGRRNHTFTFRLPAVGEAAFKWQVTFNFEARLLTICAGLFFVGLSSPARWNSVRSYGAPTGRDLERSPLAAVQGQGMSAYPIGSAGAGGRLSRTAPAAVPTRPINHRL
jgi:hypothetical protein